jgi:hypothetical protein
MFAKTGKDSSPIVTNCAVRLNQGGIGITQQRSIWRQVKEHGGASCERFHVSTEGSREELVMLRNKPSLPARPF